MALMHTDEFGVCLTIWQARRFLEQQHVYAFSDRGALVFQYPDQERRRVIPIFIHGKGWFYPQLELERDTIRPAPESKASSPD